MTLCGDDLVAAARALAISAHHGQVDKLGDPYIRHAARVARRVRPLGVTHEAVAWLHDVLEDTATTSAHLLDRGFPADVVQGVVAMTKRDGDSTNVTIRRACSDPIARAVKAADVADNTDPARRSRLPVDLAERLAAKYAMYRTVLDECGAPIFVDQVALSADEVEALD